MKPFVPPEEAAYDLLTFPSVGPASQRFSRSDRVCLNV